ncbi:nucleoside monophosphate kinase [Candidatus Saccharibacteria bacterium]|jgi:adenylate kinase|nr:nucleoside monophosphate kinase [Candidatus Saccharibacteria bacterium]NCU43705.1 nucleoside monophosphate kinase [Candidatus Saccharibacteria bacterium]
MVIFFGPAGAGKSVQGNLLAARNDWRWLGAGQLLRDSRDPELLAEMSTGKLVNPEIVNKVMGEALDRADDRVQKVILDGFPRQLEQAKWLVEHSANHGNRKIDLVIVLEVPRSEVLRRLEIRGRLDDQPEVIDERLKIYRQEMYPVLNFLNEQGVAIAHIDGTGTVGQVHDRVMEEITACGLA